MEPNTGFSSFRQNHSELKRDPWAREIELFHYPECDCIARDTNSYPWHDGGWHPPAFHDLVVVSVPYRRVLCARAQNKDIRKGRVSKFLDVLDRIEYLAELGVNAIQPLPVVEFPGEWGLGYRGTDLFSPEMDYSLAPNQLAPYLNKANHLLQKKGKPALTAQQLEPQVNQLKATIDICHLYGLAVIIDVVYNHGGGGFDDRRALISSIWIPAISFLGDWGGGRIFDYGEPEVREFLISNARMFLDDITRTVPL